MFKRYKFNSRGVGIISSKIIPRNTLVGNYFTKTEPITIQSRFIYDGWIETNPLGRYLNHNNIPNCDLVISGDTIEIYTNKEIPVFEELTVNYLKVIELINLPQSLIERYSIIDYDYIEEEVVIKQDLI
jgi:hypothetical protein